MADIQNKTITQGSVANVNVINYEIAATVLDSETQAVIADYNGDNSLHFPAVLNTLTTDQQRELIEDIAQKLILMKAGVT